MRRIEKVCLVVQLLLLPSWAKALSRPALFSPACFSCNGPAQANRVHRGDTCLHASSRYVEDLYGAIHRKEHEIATVKRQKTREGAAGGTTDPTVMAMGYVEESVPSLRLAKALRRVYDDPAYDEDDEDWQDNLDEKEKQSALSMRRGSFVADIKRKSLSSPGEVYARFDDASMVAEAMVDAGADCVFVNVDYNAYGGDLSELQAAVRAVRKSSNPRAAVVMKDIVVDELQIGMAKEAGADAILLIASVLGPALPNFLDLCTVVGIESIVEVHTKNEVEVALNALAQNLLVTNYDRMRQEYHPDQAQRLAALFPGSGPIVALATGGIQSPEDVRKLLCAGYDGVVVGKAIMGSASAPSFIKEVRDRPILPAEFAGWGLDDYDVGMDGSFTTDDDTPQRKRQANDELRP